MVLLFGVLTAACSQRKEAPRSDDRASALAPKERMFETYAEIFQRGPMLPMEERTAQFLAKVGPPKSVEKGSRVWFAVDAAGDCYEITLVESGTLNGSKIFDQGRADAECGAPATK